MRHILHRRRRSILPRSVLLEWASDYDRISKILLEEVKAALVLAHAPSGFWFEGIALETPGWHLKLTQADR